MEFLTQNILPIITLMIVGTVVMVIVAYLKNIHVTPPNMVAVISGSKRQLGDAGAKVGYRIVTGGRFFLMPVLEKVDFISLNLMTFPVEVHNVPSKSGAPVTVKAVANVKVRSEHEMLGLVVERFLGKTPAEIQGIAKENLESNLRSIVGKMEIEELLKERDKLQQQVLHEAVTDLGKMGLGVDLLNVQSVEDSGGYIKALGESRTAQVKRDAAVGTAEAQKEQEVRVQQARIEATAARQTADLQVSNQTRETQLQIADNDARVQAAQAKVPLIAQQAAAQEQAKLNVANVAAEMARVEKATELQEKERKRKQAELEATVVVTAEKTAQSNIIAAQGQATAAEQLGEAEKIKVTKAAEGKLAETRAEAEGRVAQAEAAQREQEAQAAGEKAKLLAEAEGKKAALLAEAEGMAAKAEALKKLDEGGRFLMILAESVPAIEAAGRAAALALTPVAGAIGEGFKSIDEVKITQLGPGGGNNAVKDFAAVPVETIVTLIEKAKALGLDQVVKRALSAGGVDIDGLKK